MDLTEPAGRSADDQRVDETGQADGATDAPNHDGDLSKDVVFGVLKNQRRRRALEYLDQNGAETTLDQLAEHIAAQENGIDVSELDSSQRKRVYISLYQSHLPKMDDVGIIDYNRPRGQIELREAAEQLFPYLYLESGGRPTRRTDDGESAPAETQTGVTELLHSVRSRF